MAAALAATFGSVALIVTFFAVIGFGYMLLVFLIMILDLFE